MPLINGPGYYMTRYGRRVWVCHNSSGWLDGLPFVCSNDEGEEPRYTVNEDGFLYPADHPLFRDDNEKNDYHNAGMWQPDMFKSEPQPRYEMRDDLVQRWKGE